MRRSLILLIMLNALISCSKKEYTPLPPVVIPDIITGDVSEFSVTPLDITAPDKGSFFVTANNSIYKVDYSSADQPQSNSTLSFASDTILTDNSREFANLGKDAIAYYPVRSNEITINFKDGKKVTGTFNPGTSFGGVFGEQLIAQWRDPADPSKPNQKAKDDIINFVKRYRDKDGPGPGTTPVYLLATVSKQ